MSVPGLLVMDGGGGGRWIWRTDLGNTQPFWKGIPPFENVDSVLFPC